MAKLDGKIILIAGGAGNVGEGIVATFLEEGATVIVPSRRAEALDSLREFLVTFDSDRFVGIVGNIGQLEDVEKVRDEILQRFGRLDGVLASLGGWWTGNKPLTEVSIETWNQYLESNLTSHFLLARTFVPILTNQKSGTYTLLGGTAAEVPLPRVSPVGITAAGQLMMVRILIEETKGSGVRINEVIVQGMVRTRVMQSHSSPEWITPTEIGEFAVWLASDEAYMVSGSILHLNQRPR
ncbi:SDR family NAD(P)-dependent oxidoreductase [Microcystis aeruginosa]|uniref:Short-chain dehydrogenase/reductase SDR n=2 Tax=Microcystis aeruginosa TaxID=1126 RepID=A0A6H9FY19_MICAE|nr:SDR family oxidoreductase [Microcystis aeruginosa]GCA81750.1 (S)-1-phenylethanol dehydrogenase [Microcystis aeruginosa NIES-2521]GCL48001.1 short-chain dehydrogenase/reductase SDR [Microcystis aeruginosa NIES-3787]